MYSPKRPIPKCSPVRAETRDAAHHRKQGTIDSSIWSLKLLSVTSNEFYDALMVPSDESLLSTDDILEPRPCFL